MASLSLEDGRSIVELLECPVCVTTMKPPIFQCRSGHSVCSECKPRVAKCPTCRRSFTATRNRLAEEFAYKVKYPCKNTVRGCNEKVPLEAMKKHESVCPYRMYHCLVGREDGCTWTGPRSAILPHTKQKHGKCIYRINPHALKFKKFYLFRKRKVSRIFPFCGEIFLFRSERDPQKRTLCDVMQYIGPEDNASKYAYEHRLVSPSGDQKLTFVNVVKSETDEITNTLEMRKCFVMDYDTLKNFTQKGKAFKYEIKMCKQK
jgi:E3 ubiquitin-protein ligase SIAH1